MMKNKKNLIILLSILGLLIGTSGTYAACKMVKGHYDKNHVWHKAHKLCGHKHK